MALDDLDIRRRSVLTVGTALAAATLAGACSASATPSSAPDPGESDPTSATARRTMYLGTYTSDPAQGVGLAGYDPATGRPVSTGTVAGVANPSFLALSGSHLYAVDEQANGSVVAVSLAARAHPAVLGSQSTGGSGPCHVSVHPGGGYLFSANYDSGSVAVHPINGDGSLGARSDLVQHTGSGPDRTRQDGPHAHMVLSDPRGGYVLAVDLGTDAVHSYRLDAASGRLAPVSRAQVSPGSGPRHLAFHPSGQFAYLVHELGDAISVCRYDQGTGTLTPGRLQPTVPSGSPSDRRNYPAEVVVSPDGSFVYVSNRGHDSVARFAVGGAGASLTLLDAVPSGGSYPRHISLDPTATLLFAANQNSDTVTSFRRDRQSGALTPTGESLRTPNPVCVLPA